MEYDIIGIEKDDETQLILGHAGFIKAAEDLYEAMTGSAPRIKFGIAFAEASGKRLIRTEGNDDSLEKQAAKNLLSIRAGHTFLVLFKGAFPINVVRHVSSVSEVACIYCATANPVNVLIAREKDSSAILGIIDGQDSISIESEDDRRERRELVRKMGYKK